MTTLIRRGTLKFLWWYRLYGTAVFASLFPFGLLSGCRQTPTCSVFASEEIEAHGVFRGGLRALMRFLRCNPFSS